MQLTPFLGLPSEELREAVNRGIELSDQELGVLRGLGAIAAKSVLDENFKNRNSEAQMSWTNMPESDILHPKQLFGTETNPKGIEAYTRIRYVESDPDATIADRIKNFRELSFIGGYEIHARKLPAEADFFDVSLAHDLASEIDASATEHCPIETGSLPKLTRLVKDENDGSEWFVVTHKSIAADLTIDGGAVQLKSRRAGLLDASKLSPAERELCEELLRHPRSEGRTDQLIAQREILADALLADPSRIRPVVESMYLCRPNIDATLYDL